MNILSGAKKITPLANAYRVQMTITDVAVTISTFAILAKNFRVLITTAKQSP